MPSKTPESFTEGSEHPSDQYRDRGRWIFPTLAALLIVGVVAFFWVPKSYHSAKIARGLALAEQARAAMATNDWETAGPRLKAALELAPKDVGILRLVAQLCDQYQMAEAITYWTFVINSSEVTHKDRQKYVASTLAHQRLDLAQPVMEKLAQEDEDDMETLRLSIAFLQEKGQPDAAIFVARRAFDRHPTNEAPQLALGSLLVQNSVPERAAEGRLLLWSLVAHTGPFQKDAVQILAKDPGLSRGERTTLLSYVEKIVTPALEDRLAVYSLRIQVDEALRPSLIRDAVNRGLPPASVVDTTRVLLWLVEQQAFAEVLELMPWRRARQNQLWTFWHLSALGSLQRWEELKPRLNDKTVELDPVRRYGMIATMDFALGDTNGCRNDLESAISASGERPEQLVPLARQATSLGEPDLAIEAYARTLSFTPFARSAAHQIIVLSQFAELPDPLIAACRRLRSFEPDNQTAFNELVYTTFIFKRRDPSLEAELEKAVSAPGAPGGYIISYALLHLLRGEATEALDLLEGRSIDWGTAPTRWKVAYAAALGANKQNEAARRIVKTMDPSTLRKSERVWIQSWL